MITKLTEKEVKAQAKYVKEGLAMGKNTEPADRKRAEKAISELYKMDNGRPAPEFYWVSSPLEAMKLIAKERGEKFSYNGNFFSGQHNAAYVSWVRYYRDVLAKNHPKEIKFDKKALDGFKLHEDISESCGWWWPMEGACVVSDRPKVCKVDDRGQVHNEDGPCWEFRDGFKAYGIHGVIVPEKVVMNPKGLTIDEISGETNVEIQRIMIDRFGAYEYLAKVGAELMDEDKLELKGSSSRALLKDAKGNKWLIVTDGSTGRVYHLAVPRESKTCKEAHGLVCGFDESLIVSEA